MRAEQQYVRRGVTIFKPDGSVMDSFVSINDAKKASRKVQLNKALNEEMGFGTRGLGRGRLRVEAPKKASAIEPKPRSKPRRRRRRRRRGKGNDAKSNN